VFVKICGITTSHDALLATAVGADALGFVFAPSVRQVQPADVREIARRLPHGVTTVGVFRNERPERIVTIVSKVGLHGVQLSGHEPLSEVRWIRERVPFVIQAFTAGDPALATAANGPADAVLVDSPNPGSGRVFDWTLAEGAPGGVKLILAGGLTHDNVGEAIARVRPWGVDVSSGVESTPGRKDARKLRLFVEEARVAGERLSDTSAETIDLVELNGRHDDDHGREREDAAVERSRPFDWMFDA
jgi:phosphoribosylanthranilate isomerase